MRRTIRIAVGALLLTMSLATGAQAASPHQVDPGLMTPPLNPDYDPWICTVTGGGPICRGSTSASWVNDPLPFGCGAATIYTTGSFSSAGSRWHLPDGRATHTVFQNAATEHWTLSPTGGGPTVNVKSTWIEHFSYGVPGDITTRIKTVTGADWQATAPGAGVVWHDVGLVRFEAGVDGGIDLTHGPHDSNHGDIDIVLPAVCAVLTS